jgi:hypothetical protein
MEIIAVANIFISMEDGTYFPLRSSMILKKEVRYVSNSESLLPIYAGMRTMVSDGVSLYYMGDTTKEIHDSDWVCQQEAVDGIIGSDWVCESLFKYSGIGD